MIISGVAVQPSGEMIPVKALALALNLDLGQLLLARVSQLLDNGRGVFQLPDGSTLSFAKGFNLTEGEQVRLQVVALAPEVALKVVASETGTASRLAATTERNLLKAPDLFTKLLNLTGMAEESPPQQTTAAPAQSSGSNQAPAPAAPTPAPGSTTLATTPPPLGTTPAPDALIPAAPPPSTPGTTATGTTAPLVKAPTPPLAAEQGMPMKPPQAPPLEMASTDKAVVLNRSFAGLLVTAKDETLSEVLRTNLPNLSLDELIKGDTQGLAKLFIGQGSGNQLGETIRRLRQAADTLHLKKGADDSTENSQTKESIRGGTGEALLQEAKHSLNRLGDLLASQDLLPKGQPLSDNAAFLGYRLFWMPEGGMGEVIWQRDQPGKGAGKGDGKGGFTVLLSLQLTRLGLIQAKLSMGEGYLNVGIAAHQEESLEALRQEVGELRRGLLKAELPLRTLNLTHLSENALLEERRASLGLASGLRLEA